MAATHCTHSNRYRHRWVIRYNYRFGSLHFMYKIFGFYHICVIMSVIALFVCSHCDIISNAASFVFGALLFGLTISIYVTILCKTRRLPLADDIFYIHWEAKAHVRLLCGYIVVGCINMLLVEVIRDTVLETFIFAPIYCVIIYWIHHISTHGIIHKNEQYIKRGSTSADMIQLEETASPQISPSSSPAASAPKIRFADILANDQTLHLFMIHLSKESSMECLLAFIEMKQYQGYIMDSNGIRERIHTDGVQFGPESEVQLAPHVPMSAIVCKKYENVDGIDEESVIKLKGYELYQKYIRQRSEFEINISWDQRHAADIIFQDRELLLSNNAITIIDILQLFESLKIEMFLLLRYSWHRFATQPEYSKIVAVFKND